MHEYSERVSCTQHGRALDFRELGTADGVDESPGSNAVRAYQLVYG
jgi:hypothetical protein